VDRGDHTWIVDRWIADRQLNDDPIARSTDRSSPHVAYAGSCIIGVSVLLIGPLRAEVAELADAQASGACGRKVVEVQILSSAPLFEWRGPLHPAKLTPLRSPFAARSAPFALLFTTRSAPFADFK
jgi:hypothetical protein